MKILILTPDTDIDRRITLQANELVNLGHEITIIGAPYNYENYLSGKISSDIKVNRVDSKDIKYDSKAVDWYNDTHKNIDEKAKKRNIFLEKIAACGYTNKGGFVAKFRNKSTTDLIKTVNFISTKWYALLHKIVNRIYNLLLLYMRTVKLDFFPNFDDAFYNAAKEIVADCIVANDLPSLFAADRIAKERNIPLIYDAHENYTEQCTIPKKIVKLYENIESKVLPTVKFWIVPNEFLGDAVIEKYNRLFGVEISKPIVIQNAVAYIDSIQKTDTIREKLNLESSKKIVLFQGGYLPNRNLENLIRAMKYIKNGNIVLVMLGFGTYQKELEKLAKKLNVSSKIYFMDAVPQSELLKYTSSADIGLIPYSAVDKNTYYCSPNKLYEYIQSRLPILANDLPFLRKVVVGNEIGNVANFENPKCIANEIELIIAGESLEIFKMNLEKIAYEYSWENESKKLIGSYEF